MGHGRSGASVLRERNVVPLREIRISVGDSEQWGSFATTGTHIPSKKPVAQMSRENGTIVPFSRDFFGSRPQGGPDAARGGAPACVAEATSAQRRPGGLIACRIRSRALPWLILG